MVIQSLAERDTVIFPFMIAGCSKDPLSVSPWNNRKKEAIYIYIYIYITMI